MQKTKALQYIETVIVTTVTVLCVVVIFNLVKKLGKILPWRVNCWFCNQNTWVKLPLRNSWTCPKCEQYNGFTKDGDYNKPIFSPNDKSFKKPRSSSMSPAYNGLCKMCNINQQLKVTQLANFVPINDKSFDDEIESFRSKLEKAYKLCSPCKKLLQMKLHKEKETLLGSKLTNSRTPEKNNKRDLPNRRLKNALNNVLILISAILFLFSSIELYFVLIKDKNLQHHIIHTKKTATIFLERLFTVVENKIQMLYPNVDFPIFEVANEFIDHSYELYRDLENKLPFDKVGHLCQSALGGLACFIQILGQLYTVNDTKYSVILDFLLTVFILTEVFREHLHLSELAACLIKVSSIFVLLVVLRSLKKNQSSRKSSTPVKRHLHMKNLANKTVAAEAESSSSSNSMDSDDDISLTKFGLHNFTDSSNENCKTMNSTFLNGRAFTPRQHTSSVWSSPTTDNTRFFTHSTQSRPNTTLCANSVFSKSPSSVTDTLWTKPALRTYQNMAIEDSDSDDNLSISSLRIGSPKKAKSKTNSIFSLRKFVATPSFVAPSVVSMNRGRPLISPSKLGHGTSWVAGGYWGAEAKQPFSVQDSRSSSQSSGFESHASSGNLRAAFSQPPSREESVWGEKDRNGFERFSSNVSNQFGQNCSRMGSPVYPQMQYNSHVHIPQPRSAAYVYSQQHYTHDPFKTPGRSGLFNMNAFTSQ